MRPDKDMKGWYRIGQSDLPAEMEGGEQNHDNEVFPEPSKNGGKWAPKAVDVICPLVVVARVCHSGARDVADQV